MRRFELDCLEADSQHALSRQHAEHAHKQHAWPHEFDSAIKDKDEAVHALQRELANHKEHTFLELEQARVDADMANSHALSLLMGLLPLHMQLKLRKDGTVAAVAQAGPVPAHSPGLSLGASAGNVSLRARKSRKQRHGTPPVAQPRVPSMGAVRKRTRSKGNPPKAVPPRPVALQAQGGASVPSHLHGNDGETPLGTDEDPPPLRRNKPEGDPGSSGDDDGYEHHQVSQAYAKLGSTPASSSSEGEQDQADLSSALLRRDLLSHLPEWLSR